MPSSSLKEKDDHDDQVECLKTREETLGRETRTTVNLSFHHDSLKVMLNHNDKLCVREGDDDALFRCKSFLYSVSQRQKRRETQADQHLNNRHLNNKERAET